MREILLLEVLKGIMFGLGLFGVLIIAGKVFRFTIETKINNIYSYGKEKK